MELLKYELYKIFSRKVLYIAVIILALLTLQVFWSNSNALNQSREVYNSYKNYEGPITEAKVNMAQEGLKGVKGYEDRQPGETITFSGKGMTKAAFYDTVLQHYELLKNYNSGLQVLENAKKKMQLEGKKDTYLYRLTNRYETMLKQLRPPQIYLYFGGWPELISYISHTHVIIISILLLLGIAPVFSNEYTSGMDSLILSTRKGKRKIVTAKITAALIYTLAVVIFFQLLCVTYFGLKYGFINGDRPIQNLLEYAGSPYNWTIAQYYIYELILHTCGAVAFAIFILFVSSIFKSSLVSMFTGGAVLGLPMFIDTFIHQGILAKLIEFGYGRFIAVIGFFSIFKTYNIFGYPVMYVDMALIVFSALTLTFFFLIYRSFRNHQVAN